jgi:3-methylfumaryl-CoA hydratase
MSSKNGATGPLVFVTVRHEMAQDGGVASPKSTTSSTAACRSLAPRRRRQDAPPEGEPPGRATIVPDPVLLFRYSALTFNGHRIHYDRSYVTEVEGYPGLIVHGPLIATLLLDLAAAQAAAGAHGNSVSFRAVGPLFDIEPFTVCGSPDANGRTVRLWARNMRGELAMQAEAAARLNQPLLETPSCRLNTTMPTRTSATRCAHCAPNSRPSISARSTRRAAIRKNSSPR